MCREMDWIIIGNIALYAFIVVLIIDVITYILRKSGKISKNLYDKLQPYILVIDFVLIIIFWIAIKYKY